MKSLPASGRARRAPLAVLACSAWLAGCGVGSVAGLDSLDDDSSSGGDTPGAVSAFAVESPEEPDATIRFRLIDEQGDDAEVSFWYEPPGQPAQLMTELVGTGNPARLSASKNGVEHEIGWSFPDEESLPSDGSFEANVRVYALVQGGSQEAVDGANAHTVGLGNDAPEITDAPGPDEEEVDGIVALPFTVADTSSDLVKIRIEYHVLGDEPDVWQLARPSGMDETPYFAFEGVQAPPEGADFTFHWDTDEDLREVEHDVLVRFTAVEDEEPGWEGMPAETPPFRVDNNEVPTAFIDNDAFALSLDRRRGIPLRFSVVDPEEDEVQVVVQWARNSGDFPDLPTDPAEVAAILADPLDRLEYQIATEFPAPIAGRVTPLADPTTVRLPELAARAATLLADGEGAGGLGGLVGRTLEILRPSDAPARVASGWSSGNPLKGPVAALPLGDGPTALVLDGAGTNAWRLAELDVATGAIVRELAAGTGNPNAITYERFERTALVASDFAGAWAVARVELASGTVTPLVAADGTTDQGPVRGIASLGTSAALVTVGSSLVFVDFADPLEPRSATVLSGLKRPWGLVVDPLRTNRVWLSVLGSGPFGLPDDLSSDGGRVLSVGLDTREQAPVVAHSPTGRLAFPRAESIALERSGTRLLVVTDEDPADGTKELRTVDVGRSDGTEVRTILSDLPDAVGALATSPGGMRLLALPAADDLAIGGGVAQRRTVVSYDPARQAATVDAAFDPLLRPLDRWRVSGMPPLRGSPQGRGAVFVWDSADVGRGGQLRLRATAIDADLGTPGESVSRDVVGSSLGEPLDVGLGFLDFAGDPEVVDIDGDGDLDLVNSNNVSHDLTIFFQTRPGVFDPEPMRIGHQGLKSPGDLEACDVEGDGDVDLVVGGGLNEQPGHLAIFLQERLGGEGTNFNLHQIIPETFHLGRPSAVDLNGDGLLDIVNGKQVFFQKSPAVFDPSPSSLGSDWVNWSAPGDLDGDGDVDLVGSNYVDFRLELFFQDDGYPGEFDSPVPLGEGWMEFPRRTAAGDLDGDGLLDVASANQDSHEVTIFFQSGSGAGVFEDVPTKLKSTLLDYPVRVTLGDLDGDRDLDVVVGTGDPITALFLRQGVFFQTAPGQFDAPLVFDDPTREAGWDVRSADIDGDGDVDLVAIHPGSDPEDDTLRILFRLGPGRLDPDPQVLETPELSPPMAKDVSVADLNRDGLLDVVILGLDQDEGDVKLYVFFQRSPGVFDEGILELSTQGSNAEHDWVATADLDGDGDVDLLASRPDRLLIGWQVDDEPGAFTDWHELSDPSMKGIRAVATADLDGDGKLDLVTANRDTDNLTLWRQTAPEQFELAGALADPERMTNPESVVAADLDGDGDLDLVSANLGTDNLTVWLRTDTGDFVLDPEFGVLGGTMNPRALIADDLDGDGDLDLASANRGSDDVRIFWQTEPGRFDPTPRVLGKTGITDKPSSLSAGDIDNDGDLDLAVANEAGDALAVFFQTRPGQFDPFPTVLSSDELESPQTVIAHDIDGDGDLDLVSANLGSGNLTIFWGDHEP